MLIRPIGNTQSCKKSKKARLARDRDLIVQKLLKVIYRFDWNTRKRF